VKSRVLIADDHALVRRGLRSLLQGNPDWEVCGEASSSQEAIDKAKELLPDVIIMDISMPGVGGLEATRQVREILPQIEVLVVTMHESREMMRAARDAGARGYLVKSASIDRLVETLDAVRQHQFAYPRSLDADPVAGRGDNPRNGLDR
jgi:DNA-binding NarL/FixJ family response regulator